MRPAEELYSLSSNGDCVSNLASDARYADTLAKLRERMETELQVQQDPRILGRGYVFDEYKPTTGAGFYDQFQRGLKPKAGWVNPTDFETEVIPQP